jgi:hypothetical protein
VHCCDNKLHLDYVWQYGFTTWCHVYLFLILLWIDYKTYVDQLEADISCSGMCVPIVLGLSLQISCSIVT